MRTHLVSASDGEYNEEVEFCGSLDECRRFIAEEKADFEGWAEETNPGESWAFHLSPTKTFYRTIEEIKA